MRILVAQLNPTIGDFESNTHKILKAIEKAKKERADIALFPELALCGYSPEDLLLHPDFIDIQQHYLEKIIAASTGLMVILGLVRQNPEKGEKPIFNSAAIIQDGKLLSYEDKRLLPTYDVFDERRYFEPGIDTPVWKYKGKKIAVLICEDIWHHAGFIQETKYERDPILALQPFRPDLLLNISASPYQFEKPNRRTEVCSKSATTLRCPVIMACQVGANDQLVFDGHSLYVDKEGILRQVAKGFEEDHMLIDLEEEQKNTPALKEPIAELYEALKLGVHDYLRKQGFQKACVGLSGGIDSALVACIAKDALGKENVLGVAMPSRYSSKESLEDAEQLAKNLGISFQTIPIEAPFQSFLDLLEPHFQKKPLDFTEENLQARIRGMILMSLSNKLGYILLSTSNKSEMGIGYCTLYGDMCGGLAVIADVMKEQVYALAHYCNRKGEVIPLSTLTKAPSAELRPNQKDTDSLPEYPLLDKVLISYIEERLSPEQIAQKHSIPLELVRELLHRLHQAEYKRRQAPPCIRVSSKAFGVGRRYPIVHRWI